MQTNLIMTCGGSGLARCEVTPEAAMTVIESAVPDIHELMRSECFRVAPRASLSRGIAGVRTNSLIVNLPRKREGGGGKPKRDFAGARPCVEHVVEIREMWLARHMPTIDEQTKMFCEVTDKWKACS